MQEVSIIPQRLRAMSTTKPAGMLAMPPLMLRMAARAPNWRLLKPREA
jgi:hypothetical protein